MHLILCERSSKRSGTTEDTAMMSDDKIACDTRDFAFVTTDILLHVVLMLCYEPRMKEQLFKRLS